MIVIVVVLAGGDCVLPNQSGGLLPPLPASKALEFIAKKYNEI